MIDKEPGRISLTVTVFELEMGSMRGHERYVTGALDNLLHATGQPTGGQFVTVLRVQRGIGVPVDDVGYMTTYRLADWPADNLAVSLMDLLPQSKVQYHIHIIATDLSTGEVQPQHATQVAL